MMLEYLKKRQKYSYKEDEVTYFLIPLCKNYYLDCEYMMDDDKEDIKHLSMTIVSWKQKAFLDELYKGELGKVATLYTSGDFNTETTKIEISNAPITIYKEIDKIDNFEIDLVKQGYTQFIENELIATLDIMDSPWGIFDALFKSSYKTIWTTFEYSFIFLSLEIGWSKERILEELYSPYMRIFLENRWRSIIKKPLDTLFLEVCETAYKRIENLEFELPNKSLYDYDDYTFDKYLRDLIRSKVLP